MIMENPEGEWLQIDSTSYINSSAVIIGKVKIGSNVYVGPGAVIRADERGSSVIINDNCNIQDRVVIHALENSSVLIEENTSLSHGCIIHGPCKIGSECFIGFGSVVFNAEIGEKTIVKHLCCIEGVTVSPEKVMESGNSINSQKEVTGLKFVDKKLRIFAGNVVKVNLDLVKRYKNV